MSGIIGVYHLDGRPVRQMDLDSMVHHVAPWQADNRNVWLGGHVGFGHCMLHAMQESLCERLLLSLGDRLVITADARIDNRKELIEG